MTYKGCYTIKQGNQTKTQDRVKLWNYHAWVKYVLPTCYGAQRVEMHLLFIYTWSITM